MNDLSTTQAYLRLKQMGACHQALAHVLDCRSTTEAWETASPEWQGWLIYKLDPTMRKWHMAVEALRGIEHLMRPPYVAMIGQLEQWIVRPVGTIRTAPLLFSLNFAENAVNNVHLNAISFSGMVECAHLVARDSNAPVSELIRRHYPTKLIIRLLSRVPLTHVTEGMETNNEQPRIT